MDMHKHITDGVKNTVGYREAKDKDSFMVGVSVAIMRTESYMEKRMTQLENQVKELQRKEEEVKTLVQGFERIRSRYYGE